MKAVDISIPHHRHFNRKDNPRRYWNDLKHKLAKEVCQLYDKIVQLKLPTQKKKGMKRLQNVAS